MTCTTADAYRLFHEGTLALAQVEANGICVDRDYLAKATQDAEKQIAQLEEELKQENVWKTWLKAYPNKANLTSRTQLADVLFNKMGFPCLEKTPGGQPSADEAHLQTVKLPFIDKYLHKAKLDKMHGTYLKGIAREVDVNGFLHPVFNLSSGHGKDEEKGGARSYRSSCQLPNFQNMPIRNKVQGETIRRCFIPRPGNVMLEIDYCLVGSTKIETPNGSRSIENVVSSLENGEEIFVYGYDNEKKRIGVSKIVRGAKTRQKAEVWRVVLDNGEEIVGTKNHKFMLRDGSNLPLGDLRPGMSLMPFYKKNKKSRWGTVYSNIYLNNGETRPAHQLVALDVFGVEIKGSNKVVHHKDGNGTNNDPSNLEVMTRVEHMRIHSKQGWEKSPQSRLEWARSKENIENLIRGTRERVANLTDADREELSKRASESIKARGGHKGEKNPRFGQKVSEETRKKMSLRKKGKKTGRSWNKGHTKKTHPSVAKISAAKIGKPNLSKGKKRKPLSDEQKRKMSISLTGRVVSQRERDLLSQSKKEFWANKKAKQQKEQCPICQKEFYTLGSHMRSAHGTTPREYRKTYNHKVVSVEFVGYQDVYNITVDKFHNYALSAGVIVLNCALEFRVIACYWKDPALIAYANDPTKDIHRDVSAGIYALDFTGWEKKQYKDIRYCGKNKFVFPQFYGSDYIKCAPALYHAIDEMKLTTPDGKSLKKHLASKGITELGACDRDQRPKPGTFEYHVERFERKFWDEWFPTCARERDLWVKNYRKRGYFDLHTGFRIEGVYSRNKVFNLPVQGSGFHCLLWSLIRAQKYLNKHKCKTLIVGQIHDSVLFDMHPDELDSLGPIIREIMTKLIRKHWPWIIVDFDIEADLVAQNQSWHDKKPIKM